MTKCKILETELTKSENILHVFDLITDNVINAKIGKKVVEIIFVTCQIAEYVIKNIGLRQCSPDQIAALDIIKKLPYLLHRAQNGDEKAKHELADQCMRQSGANINPGFVRQFIDNRDALLKEAEKETTT